jgi:hypothetical protein
VPINHHVLLVGLLVPVGIDLEIDDGEVVVSFGGGAGRVRQLHVSRKANGVEVGVLLERLLVHAGDAGCGMGTNLRRPSSERIE